jgi:hypothetical protein
MNHIDIEKIRGLLSQVDATVFSPEIYRETGLFVLHRVMPEASIRGQWRTELCRRCRPKSIA